MTAIERGRTLLLAAIVTCTGALPCLSRQTKTDELIWPRLLERANLEIRWQHDLPLVKSESLNRLFLIEDRLYALTSQNYLFSLNRNSGGMVFGTSLAAPGLVVPGFRLYDDGLIAAIGNELVEIDPNTGQRMLSRGVDFGLSCLPAGNTSFFYIPGADGRIRVIRRSDVVKLFEVAAPSRSSITSVIASDDLVVFSTTAGEVVAIAPDSPKRLWQFNAGGRIIGPLVRDGRMILAASEDTYVYNLDAKPATRPIWKHQTAAILNKAPRVTRQYVYQYVNTKGLTAIDKVAGTLVWQVPDGLDILAEAPGKAYVFKEKGELVVMDSLAGKKLYSVNVTPASLYAANLTDSKIYLADKKGRVVCLRPTR